MDQKLLKKKCLLLKEHPTISIPKYYYSPTLKSGIKQRKKKTKFISSNFINLRMKFFETQEEVIAKNTSNSNYKNKT